MYGPKPYVETWSHVCKATRIPVCVWDRGVGVGHVERGMRECCKNERWSGVREDNNRWQEVRGGGVRRVTEGVGRPGRNAEWVREGPWQRA